MRQDLSMNFSCRPEKLRAHYNPVDGNEFSSSAHAKPNRITLRAKLVTPDGCARKRV